MKRYRAILFTLFFALLFTSQAFAISLDQAARQVAAQYKGRVVAAHTENRNGKMIHVIRVITKDGKVKTVKVPAG